MPSGIEYIKYLREVAQHYDVFIVESPNTESVRQYLSGEINIDQLLYDIEYFNIDYTREFYKALREFNEYGIDVIPVDPYSVISVGIRIKAMLHNLDYKSLSSDGRYVAFMELKIAEAHRAYNSALLRGDFEDAVRWLIKYARLDAERIKFRSELRAREIVKILRNLGKPHDVLIHADHYNEVLVNYLGKKLMCMPSVIRLDDVACKRLGVRPLIHPGIKLTNNYVYGMPMNKGEEYLLASRAMIYALLKARIFGRVNRRMLGDKAILIDNSLKRLAYRLSIDDAKDIFRKLMMPGSIFKVRV
ncbi:conserved hypothetical protein [Vulcanisaeta distributa DSM 14429]|uniref:Uncharacterized protein n=2 Tax=Vulcanisaeta distributa TaxID=164451 RepID=E1QPI1_VULDI|nr:conserved hypothetical protein [Vulcanisaeta distributa DSM 14429]